MIGRWRNWPLKRKLLFLTLFTSTLGIALVCLCLVVLENNSYRKQMESELHAIASILAEQSAAAVLFEDQGQLNNILSSLQIIDTIQLACVFNAENSLLSSLGETDDTACPDLAIPPALGFQADYYQLLVPIVIDAESVGKFYLRSHLQMLRQHIRYFVLATTGIGLLILLFLVLVALRLQRIISQPILDLSEVAGRIAQEHDYSIRAPISGRDELGRLGSVFNEMIATIQSQNQRILDSQKVLERKVEERTSELSLANRELEAFSYSVSHDLRQPLRAIDGFSQALEEDCTEQLDQTGRDYLHRIRAAANRMGHLIDGLLVLSRVSRQPLELETVDLSAMLAEIAEDLSQTTDKLPTQVLIQPDMNVGGDGRLLRIAFQNILENAWKYTARKEERIVEITARTGQHFATIAVKDNGAGFDMKYVDKLFVAFNRLHTPAEFTGTGIGLATVYRVIRRHHGDVSAESAPGEGATFYINLPLPTQGS